VRAGSTTAQKTRHATPDGKTESMTGGGKAGCGSHHSMARHATARRLHSRQRKADGVRQAAPQRARHTTPDGNTTGACRRVGGMGQRAGAPQWRTTRKTPDTTRRQNTGGSGSDDTGSTNAQHDTHTPRRRHGSSVQASGRQGGAAAHSAARTQTPDGDTAGECAGSAREAGA